MVISKVIHLNTSGNCEVIDITSEVAKEISSSAINSGIVTVFVTGSTAGVTTIEYEPGLVADFKAMWEQIAPRDIKYEHDRAWGDGNGHAHIRASLLGPSLTVPFSNKKLMLGTWQQIVVADFDNRSRNRDIFLQLVGE